MKKGILIFLAILIIPFALADCDEDCKSMGFSEGNCQIWGCESGWTDCEGTGHGCGLLSQCCCRTTTCTDTDDGKNYFEKGEVTIQEYGLTFHDVCDSNPDRLWETYCDQDGTVANIIYDCDNGCVDGACEEAVGCTNLCSSGEGCCQEWDANNPNLYCEGGYLYSTCHPIDGDQDRWIPECIPGPDGCNICNFEIHYMETCQSVLCQDKECGPDGRGGNCGSCDQGKLCEDGLCQCTNDCENNGETYCDANLNYTCKYEDGDSCLDLVIDDCSDCSCSCGVLAEETGILCTNEIDDDCDGQTDLDDTTCSEVPPSGSHSLSKFTFYPDTVYDNVLSGEFLDDAGIGWYGTLFYPPVGERDWTNGLEAWDYYPIDNYAGYIDLRSPEEVSKYNFLLYLWDVGWISTHSNPQWIPVEVCDRSKCLGYQNCIDNQSCDPDTFAYCDSSLTMQDSDSNEAYCNACVDFNRYNIGGDIPLGCCGDDYGEYFRETTYDSIPYTACCDSSSKCVDNYSICRSGTETIGNCHDLIDNDCDTLFDCDDPDCNIDSGCGLCNPLDCTNPGYYCDGPDCTNACSQNSDCPTGFYCNLTSKCEEKENDGANCNGITKIHSKEEQDFACQSGNCDNDGLGLADDYKCYSYTTIFDENEDTCEFDINEINFDFKCDELNDLQDCYNKSLWCNSTCDTENRDVSQIACEVTGANCIQGFDWTNAGIIGLGEYTDLITDECCGDDLNENFRQRLSNISTNFELTDYPNFATNLSDNVCCDNELSCAYNNQCNESIVEEPGFKIINNENVLCINGAWYDPDTEQTFCEDVNKGNLIGKWIKAGENLVGEYDSLDKFECCGDDTIEIKDTRHTDVIFNTGPNDYPGFADSLTDTACCLDSNRCIFNETCYTSGKQSANEETLICQGDTWFDPDTDKTLCEDIDKGNFENSWVVAGELDVGEYEGLSKKECCGDDPAEYYINSTMFKGHGENDTKCCNNSDCVLDEVCYPSAAIGAKETDYGTCYDEIDNDCDSATDFCDGRFDIGCGSDGLDSDCSVRISGTVKDMEDNPIENVTVTALTEFTYNSFHDVIFFTTKTNNLGNYELEVYGNSSYDVVGDKIGYYLIANKSKKVGLDESWTADMFMARDIECRHDCTKAYTNLCFKDCDGINGCHFNSTITADLCDQKPKFVFMEMPDPDYQVECCNKDPRLKQAEAEPEVTTDSDLVVSTTKLVWYRGSLVKMIIAVIK